MKEPELIDAIQLSEDTPIVVTTDNGELLWVAEDGGETVEMAADGAEIVVVETDDGQQQIQLVTGEGGQLLTLPPELASRLKENLSGLVDDGLQHVLVGQTGEDGEGVQLQDEAVELPEGAVVLPEGAVELAEGAIDLPEGSLVLHAADELEPGGEVITMVVEGAEDTPEASSVATDPLASEVVTGPLTSEVNIDPVTSAGETGAREAKAERAEKREEDHDMDVEGDDEMTNFMKVEEETIMSCGENIEEEYAGEEIGEFLGDLGFTGSIDGLKVEQAQPDAVSAATDAPENDVPEWTESTVTSASGSELKIRLPTVCVSPLDEAAISQMPQPNFRVIQPLANTRPPVPAPDPLYEKKKKKSREDADAWAAKTRRRASRGIARAVAAVRRAEDSDSFESEDDDDEGPARAPTNNQPRRARGRPRKPGGFSCQLCSQRLETQPAFFQHLRNHYEKPGGNADETATAENTDEVSLRLEPISEQGEPIAEQGESITEQGEPILEQGEPIPEQSESISEQGGNGDGPPTINVDIIASESVKVECERCKETFFSEDIERHRKTHISEALAAEGESSDPESAPEDSEVSHATDTAQLAPLAQAESEPPAPNTHSSVADQYEMKHLKKCDDCPKLFTTLGSLTNHRMRMHNESGDPTSATNAAKLEYECEECHVTYTSHKIFERHRRLHQDKAAGRLPHHCSACGASFLTSMLLTHHMQKEHHDISQRRRKAVAGPVRPNGRPPGSSDKNRQAVYDLIKELVSGRLYGCMLCDKVGKTKNQLFYHISIKHKALEGHKCPTCSKSFFTETALRIHQRTHTGERPFGCEHCNRRFRQQTDLAAHVMSVHTLERPFRCGYCAKAFSRKYSLTVHMRCHTNERNYVCPVCKKRFRASTYLTGHMKIHTGERSHACPICQKTFRMRSDMKRHIFTHSRDRPHPRSLRALTVQMDAEDGVMLLDSNRVCVQLVTGEDGEPMMVTEGGQTMVLDGSQTVIDEQTGQMMVPESAISRLDETAVASMYLMADNSNSQPDSLEELT